MAYIARSVAGSDSKQSGGAAKATANKKASPISAGVTAGVAPVVKTAEKAAATGAAVGAVTGAVNNYLNDLKDLNKSVSKNETKSGRIGGANSALSSANAALDGANADLAAYQSQLDILNADTENSKRENWIRYMKALKALPQQMANNGINGGNTESSLVRLNANYGTNANNIDMNAMPQRTNLQAQIKAAQAVVDNARAAAAQAANNARSVGSANYVTNAAGNILSGSQQQTLNNIISRMSGLGLSSQQIQNYLSQAGF